VEPGSSMELAAAMARFIENRALALNMGRSGLERFRDRFTADIAVDRYVALYDSVIGTGRL
jgi:glycosyltransferase involved in cell wall biosynthesis